MLIIQSPVNGEWQVQNWVSDGYHGEEFKAACFQKGADLICPYPGMAFEGG